MFHSRSFVAAAILFSSASCSLAASHREARLTAADRQNVDAVLGRLRSCAKNRDELKVVDEIEQRCELMFFLRGSGIVSRKALRKLEDKGAGAAIALGLKHPVRSKRIAAAEALEKVKSPALLPAILAALRVGNYAAEGSEEPLAHAHYKRQLVSLLSELTGQQFDVSDHDDERQIAQVIALTGQWLRKNQPAKVMKVEKGARKTPK